MSSSPLVSIVIPVKDGEAYLAEALESVVAQDYKPREVLVVDGGSIDRSREIAASFGGVRIVDQRGTGLAGAWNEGIEAANGDLIALLDSDDRWLPGKLSRQAELLERDPELGYAICRVRFFLEPGHPVPPGFRPELLEGDHVARMPGALLARRAIFDEVGGFHESYGVSADLDWFVRLKDARIAVGRVDEVLLEKRVHSSNLSLNSPEYAPQMLRSLRQSVERMRAEQDK